MSNKYLQQYYDKILYCKHFKRQTPDFGQNSLVYFQKL